MQLGQACILEGVQGPLEACKAWAQTEVSEVRTAGMQHALAAAVGLQPEKGGVVGRKLAWHGVEMGGGGLVLEQAAWHTAAVAVAVGAESS